MSLPVSPHTDSSESEDPTPADMPSGAISRGGMSVEDLASWLGLHPTAMVGAVDSAGAPTEIPPGVPLGSGHQIDTRSLLELVVPEHTSVVADAFVGALRRGFGNATIRMASAPDQVYVLQYLDLRQSFGIMLRVVTPWEDSENLQPRYLDIAELQPSRPRLGLMTKDEVAGILSIDESTSLMLGWTAEEMVGRPNLDFIHPDDHVRAIDNWMSRFSNSTGHMGVIRLRYRCRDDSWLWVEISNQVHTDESGVTTVFAQLIDVSDEMAAVEALRRSEGFLRRMSDTLPVGTFHIGSDGKVVFVNPVLERLLGEAPVATRHDLARALVPDQWSVLDGAIGTALTEGVDTDLDLAVAPDGDGSKANCRITLRAVTDEGVILGVLGCVVDVTELKRMADTDSLTSLANRRSILQILDEALASHAGRVGVIFVDLDTFKPINDRHGHRIGDEVLAAVANRLQAAVRPVDVVGRLGGDEFLVVCPGLGTPDSATGVAVRLQEALEGSFEVQGLNLLLTASFGVACGCSGVTAEHLVATADAAMYEAKARRPSGPVYLPCS